MYLADAGKNRDVVTISSVSGGSLTNAFVGLRGDYAGFTTGAAFEDSARQLASRLANRGTVFAWWGTWAYLAVLVLALGGAVGAWWLAWPWEARLPVFVLGFAIWAELLGLRGYIGGLALGATLYRVAGHSARLRELSPSIDHVVCATEMHVGEHVYFSGRFVCSYELGWGGPGELPLQAAVQASAALPGAFPIRWMRTVRFDFAQGRRTARLMALMDGGVYDNMADQWLQGVSSRKDRWPGLADGLKEPEELVIVNSSAPLRWGAIRKSGVPLLTELTGVLRAKDVLYDNTTSLRRYGLVGRFDRAELEGRGLRGALVHIPQSPFKIPRSFENSTTWPTRASRAAAVLSALASEDEHGWEAIAEANCGVKTTLWGFGTEVSARLLHHAYLLGMANLHVILGYPLLPLPARDRFERLVS
jgi:hypothetical protein